MKQKLFLMSDTHFGHANILRFCPNRQFKNIDDHDEAYIENHNALVCDEDVVVSLGDFSSRNRRSVKEYIKALNGRIFILFGNHDDSAMRDRNLFAAAWGRKGHNEVLEYLWNREKYILCHFPMLSWNVRAHNRTHFFGHIHSCETRPFICQQNSCDVGVDAWNHGPVLLEDAINRAKSMAGKLRVHDQYDNVVLSDEAESEIERARRLSG